MAEEKVSSNAALYNKYRPSDFDSVYGQEDIVSSLSSAIEDGSLPHSFIFAGPRGTGKTSIARVVARALNCKNPVHGSPCGECESCRVPVSDAPGYYELDGASNAGVADARAIADEIRSGTSMADNRIFVIDEVQEMNSQAITALLKPLEEPPANTFIIFCTTDPERLPATIRSRGVTHYFNQVPDDKLTQLVIDTVEREGREPLDDETVQAVVMEGDGSPRDTLSVLQRVLMGGKAVMSGQGTILAQAIVERDLGGAIMAIAEAVSVGSTINALFSETASALRDIFICAHAPNLLSPARREDVESRFSDIETASINARAAITMVLPQLILVGRGTFSMQSDHCRNGLKRLPRMLAQTLTGPLRARNSRPRRTLPKSGQRPSTGRLWTPTSLIALRRPRTTTATRPTMPTKRR